jgi:hypothetical protein
MHTMQIACVERQVEVKTDHIKCRDIFISTDTLAIGLQC